MTANPIRTRPMWDDADVRETETCEECEGRGGYWLHSLESAATGEAPEIWERCPDCSGTGRVPYGTQVRR